MASFRKRGDLQWQARVSRKGFPPQVRTFNTRAEAEAWAIDTEASMQRGTFVDRSESERTTLAEALDRYEREITAGKKGATQEKGRISLLKASSLASMPLASIRGLDVSNYRDKRIKEVSTSSVLNELAVLSHLFTICRKEWGMENLGNPVQLIRKPKRPGGRTRRLAPEEERLLLAACDQVSPDALTPLVILALETAMRLGELLALEWQYINFESRVATLPDTKNGEVRYVPLSTRALQSLQTVNRHPAHRRVFWKWSASDTVNKPWRKAVEIARNSYVEDCEKRGEQPHDGFLTNLRFHDLRHETTSRFFEGGFNAMEVATITGHKTLQMLKRYTHLRAEDLAERLK